jgi:phosphatidate cytidylyltransferase
MVESQPRKTARTDTLFKRVIVAVILLPIGVAAIYAGGWAYTGLIALVLGIAAYEFCALFQASGLRPSILLASGGTLAIVGGRAFYGFDEAAGVLSLTILLALAYHLVDYERGRDRAATDFAATVAAILYIGWLGAYLVSLRELPEGAWWVLTVLPAVWLADSAAYMVGARLGKHKLTRRLSPNKSWEGYLAGILISIPGTMSLTLLWRALGAGEIVTPLRGAALAAVLATFTILGDLGESMIKRQVGAKDSGHLLPGHGGVFDRIDSWLWAGVIGYYVINTLFL